jgi:tRNA (mo5U34)-methyltransferase
MDSEQIRAEAEKIVWWHTIDLGHGIVTKGIEPNTKDRAATARIPADLHGKSVLDIGAWDGFFSFEAERRGASRVVAVDSFCWNGEGWGTKTGFDLARRALESRVEDRETEVLDLSPESVGVFDVVFFLGVLYHMRHPLLALERVASVTKELLILETQVDLSEQARPAMAFYPTNELNNDYTNWWGPNPAAVTAMLRDVGFSEVETVWQDQAVPTRVAIHARRRP